MKENASNISSLPITQEMSKAEERLEAPDKAALDLAKVKKELAQEKAKTALAQNESAELAHNNVVLQLALKYKLNDGDTISEDGVLQRKS